MATNHELLGRGLKLYTGAMRRVVQERLQGFYGVNWWEIGVLESLPPLQRGNVLMQMEKDPDRAPIDQLDPSHIERIIGKTWSLAFKSAFPDFNAVKGHLASAAAARTQWAHPESEDVKADDASNWLYSMQQVLERAKQPEAAEIEAVRQALIAGGRPPEPAPQPTPEPTPTPVPAAEGELPFWWQAAEPHDAFKTPGAIDEGLFAATLGAVHAGSARREYLDPEVFFGATYFTENLRAIARDVVARLAGGDGASATELQTPFGGGKTHAMLTLYHLVRDPARALAVPGVREALGDVQVPANASVLVFDGQEWGAEPVLKQSGASVYTLWGELAWQADPELYRKHVQASDDSGVAPGNAAFRPVLEAASPCLILIDELVSYLVKLRFSSQRRTQNLYRQTVQFVQELLQQAGNVPGVVVILSLPKSRNEFGGLDPNELQMQLDVLPDLQARADRVVARRTPVNDAEIYTLTSKRLFKRADPAVARRVAEAYQATWRRNESLFPPEVLTPDYREQQVAAWPLHPELIDVLYKKWSTMADFPRTRAVLQLLANVVADQWAERRPAHAIQSGHVNLERERIRSRITGAMGASTGWDAVVATDIIGGDAHADYEDERRGDEYARHHVFRGVTTSLLMHSFGGRMQNGALPEELYLSMVAPNLGVSYVSEVVGTLDTRFHYVHPVGKLRRFETKVNLVRRVADAARTQPASVVGERLRETLGRAAGAPAGFRVLAWAGGDGSLPDQPEPSIAILDARYSLAGGDAPEGTARLTEIWNRAGGGLRQWRNSLILVAPDRELWSATEQAMRDVLAHEQVLAEADRGRLELSANERRDLESRRKDREESLRTSLVMAWKWVLVPSEGGELRTIALPEAATKQDTIAGRVVQRLADRDYEFQKIMTKLSATYFDARIVPQVWKEKGTRGLDLQVLRRRFREWTYLPILPAIDATLSETIQEGIRGALWAVALGDDAADHVTRLIDSEDELAALPTLFDGTAWLVAGERLATLRARLRPDEPPVPKPDDDDPLGGNGPEPPGGKRPDPQPEPKPIPKPARHGQLRLTVETMPISKTANLQLYLFRHLQQQDAGASVRLTIEVSSGAGIPEETLEKQIVEGLEQLGITVRWEPR